MKKGRHRRFEEARALKRNQDLDLDSIFDSLSDTRDGQSGSGESTASGSRESKAGTNGRDHQQSRSEKYRISAASNTDKKVLGIRKVAPAKPAIDIRVKSSIL